MKGCSHNRAFYGRFMSKSMNKYHKRSELDSSLSGWVKVGALALGVGVGVGGVPVPGGGVSKAWGTSGAYAINVEGRISEWYG